MCLSYRIQIYGFKTIWSTSLTRPIDVSQNGADSISGFILDLPFRTPISTDIGASWFGRIDFVRDALVCFVCCPKSISQPWFDSCRWSHRSRFSISTKRIENHSGFCPMHAWAIRDHTTHLDFLATIRFAILRVDFRFCFPKLISTAIRSISMARSIDVHQMIENQWGYALFHYALRIRRIAIFAGPDKFSPPLL